MTVLSIINTLIAGGLLGVLGQGVRIAVGMKKFNESNVANATQGLPIEEFSTSRLLISIFIGFVAGAIGLLIKESGDSKPPHTDILDTESIVAIIAAGYSGADFIEGIFNTYITKFNPANKAPAAQKPAPGGNLEEEPVG